MRMDSTHMLEMSFRLRLRHEIWLRSRGDLNRVRFAGGNHFLPACSLLGDSRSHNVAVAAATASAAAAAASLNDTHSEVFKRQWPRQK